MKLQEERALPEGGPGTWSHLVYLHLIFPDNRMDVELEHEHDGLFRVASTFVRNASAICKASSLARPA